MHYHLHVQRATPALNIFEIRFVFLPMVSKLIVRKELKSSYCFISKI